MTTELTVPELSLVVLIGASSSGKSTLARRLFAPTEVVSSDACRAMVCDDEHSMEASGDAFALVHRIADMRLRRGRLTVIDATSTTPEARKPLVSLAKQNHCLPVAIVLDPPKAVLLQRHRERIDRSFSAQVIRSHHRRVRSSIRRLKREGFRVIHHLTDPEQIATATLTRQPMWPAKHRSHSGPFDIIGDIHGCLDELRTLLTRLGWDLTTLRHPEGRTAVFLGDLVDRGPDSPGVLRLVMDMVAAGSALCVPGNHEVKLLRALSGKTVRLTHGLERTMAQLEGADPAFLKRTREFIDGLVSHLILDGGRLVVSHAGIKAGYIGRASARVRQFCLYGETSGETDEYGLPIRHDWAADYKGEPLVVYGHTPTVEAQWVGRTICLDTGCAFGGQLTALRYPEQELVGVAAEKVHYPPIRPLGRPSAEGLADLAELCEGGTVTTGLMKQVTVRSEQAASALESISRFAHDPRWLLYIPPTMSPCETATDGGVLERPAEALSYYRSQGVAQVVCQEKHMGSRAVVVACRSAEVAADRFGDASGRLGVVTTRTGRPFFTDAALESTFIDRIRAAMETAGLWDDSGVVVIDGELMPWSAKARELIRSQYALVSAAGSAALSATVEALTATAVRTDGALALLRRYRSRQSDMARYTDAWQHYCSPVDGLDDYRFAPFHFLATGSTLHTGQDHVWHMETLSSLAAADPALLMATRYRVVDLADAASCEAATAWWEALTAAGGEGMVVKPRDWIVRGKRGLVQPAVKCRGREYLRIIYGPSYTEQLDTLRKRHLGRKRSLALKELALGLEGLQRFVDQRPHRRIHACVFATLAMESSPVDPRL